MAYFGLMTKTRGTAPATLTGAEAVALAERALRAGKIDTAMRYVDVAYALFDLNVARATGPARA